MKVQKDRFLSTLLLGLTIVLLTACGGGGGGGDDTPGVVSVTPARNATNVDKTTVVTATFSDGMDEVDIPTNIQAEFTLGDSSGNSVSGVAAYDDTLNIANFDPDMDLGVLKTYTATLGAGGLITHSGGTVMPQYTWSFTTAEGSWTYGAKVDVDTTVAASTPAIARGGDGEAIAVWITADGFIYGRKYSAGAWGSIDQIFYTTYPLSELRVAMDKNGNAMAVWRYDGPPAGIDLYANYYNGTSWGTATNIESTNGTASDAKVAFDSSGNAIVVWKDSDDIRANRYDVSLVTPAWEGDQLIETGAGVAVSPDLAVFDNGDAIAVWAQTVGMIDVVYSNYYTMNTGWDVTEQSLGNTGTGAVPQVAVDNVGNAVAVWLEGVGTVSVWAAQYDGGTTSWGSLTELETNAHISTTPQVGVDAQGNAIALWRAEPTTGADRLRYKFFDGASWGTVGNVDDGVADSFDPRLAMDAEGHAVVVWRQNDTMDIASAWGNRYRSGSGWVGPELLESDETYPINAQSLDLVIDYNGNAAAVWTQSDALEGIDSIWTARFD